MSLYMIRIGPILFLTGIIRLLSDPFRQQSGFSTLADAFLFDARSVESFTLESSSEPKREPPV